MQLGSSNTQGCGKKSDLTRPTYRGTGHTALYHHNCSPHHRIATRTGGGALTSLHGDHLGSVSVATNAGGGVVERQEFDPWGAVIQGGVTRTELNDTGQLYSSISR